MFFVRGNFRGTYLVRFFFAFLEFELRASALSFEPHLQHGVWIEISNILTL
jgi:hypothetical protein